ncbi:hypothetical protein [Solemya velesiana gill symbiont]|nr:hypothetical protein [Solemya velesiana gill symbiont]
MDVSDPVVWGSALTVVIACIVLGFLAAKILQLMKRDEEKHNK